MRLTDHLMDRIYGERKRSIYKRLPRTVVEIGPGAGANFRYYPPGTKVIAIEPNTAMHSHLRARAQQHNIYLEIKTMKGETIDLPDSSVSAVVGTLVLCTVEDPPKVVSEIRRILKPRGRYLFVEHVAAMPDTKSRKFQEVLFGTWRWMSKGCHLNRDTHQTIEQAGFTTVDMDCFNMQSRWVPFRPHIFGNAIN